MEVERINNGRIKYKNRAANLLFWHQTDIDQCYNCSTNVTKRLSIKTGTPDGTDRCDVFKRSSQTFVLAILIWTFGVWSVSPIVNHGVLDRSGLGWDIFNTACRKNWLCIAKFSAKVKAFVILKSFIRLFFYCKLHKQKIETITYPQCGLRFFHTTSSFRLQ